MKIKRLVPVILSLCVASVIFVGCDEDAKNEYAELNEKLSMNYSKIVLTVTNTFDDEVLTSEYAMKFTDGGMTVNYTVERFAEISLDDFTSAKTKLIGEALVADGVVTFVAGDEVDLAAITAGTGLDFKEEYFENADLTGSYFKADVKNPSGFMGTPITCTEMTVYAVFPDAFYTIQIKYTAENGNSVEYLYKFSN